MECICEFFDCHPNVRTLTAIESFCVSGFWVKSQYEEEVKITSYKYSHEDPQNNFSEASFRFEQFVTDGNVKLFCTKRCDVKESFLSEFLENHFDKIFF